MKDYTDVVIVLDRSGSMSSVKDDTEGGFNNFIQKQKQLEGKCVVSLYQFDSEFETVYEGRDIQEVPPLYLSPRWATALLDAMGRAINLTGDRLRNLPESERPNKVVFVVLTDGYENSSREFSKAQIKEKVEHQEEKYRWLFVFLGAGMDAILEGSNYGFKGGKCLSTSASPQGQVYAYETLSKHVGRVRGMSSGEYCASLNADSQLFDDEDKEKQQEAGLNVT